MSKRRRHHLKDREIKMFLLEVSTKLGPNVKQLLEPKARIEVAFTENVGVFIFNGRPLLAKLNGTLFFTLFFKELFSLFPKIVVDMGAVPYVCKGADLMAPGILSINDEFEQNSLVIVVDERHVMPLAVGVALLSSEEMKTIKRGKTVKILHYVGDKLWNNIKDS